MKVITRFLAEFSRQLKQPFTLRHLSYMYMQIEKEQKREEKKRKDSAGHPSASAESDREARGTYQSGYNNISSEQYATKVSNKPKPAIPQRPRRTQDAIKVSLFPFKTKHIHM